jgi:hypothetical protein
MTHAEIAARRAAVVKQMERDVCEARKRHMDALEQIEADCGALGHIQGPYHEGYFPPGCAICGASRRVFEPK